VNVDSSDWSPATNQSDVGEGRASVAAAAGDVRSSVYELSFMRLRPGMCSFWVLGHQLFSYLLLRMEPSDPSVGFCLLFFKTMNDDRISLIKVYSDGKRSGPIFV
jgi:hypothetical protein